MASRLLQIELLRLALCHGAVDRAHQLLTAVGARADARAPAGCCGDGAAERPRTLDSIHLVTALSLSSAGIVESLMTYDARLAQAADRHGLGVLAPG